MCLNEFGFVCGSGVNWQLELIGLFFFFFSSSSSSSNTLQIASGVLLQIDARPTKANYTFVPGSFALNLKACPFIQIIKKYVDEHNAFFSLK